MNRTTVRLPDDLLEQAKARAAGTGRTFTQLIEQAVRSELERPFSARAVSERQAVYVSRSADSDGIVDSDQSTPLSPSQRERVANQLLEHVRDLQSFLSALPDLDTRTDDEILGYDAVGLSR